MKKIVFSFLLALTCTFAFAQRGGNGERMKELRKQFIEEQLNLEGKKAEEFWKVYSKYDSEKRSLKKEMKGIKAGFNAMSDEQLKGAIDKMFVLRDKESALDKKCFKELQSVITVRQISVLYQAEHKFKREILKRLRDRMGEDIDE
ncbi:MAG: hypothetical protein ACJAWV_003074 [Flammeovirgaceae bacterium]|jgi:hypothetical protein